MLQKGNVNIFRLKNHFYVRCMRYEEEQRYRKPYAVLKLRILVNGIYCQLRIGHILNCQLRNDTFFNSSLRSEINQEKIKVSKYPPLKKFWELVDSLEKV